MKQLKQMKETLMGAVQGQLGNLAQVDYKELGAAIDMIKDLSEAVYYCSIVESMEESTKEQKKMKEMQQMMGGQQQQQQQPQSIMYFHERERIPEYYRDMDRGNGRMYYSEGGGSGGRSGGSNSSSSSGGGSSGSSGNNARGGGSRGYSEPTYMYERDEREGRSGERRRTYMESKQMNTDKNMHIKELDQYAQELTQDIMEMIHEAGPEEKQLLKKKMTELASKIV